ncbi:MAG: glycosyltransferase family 4 protein [Gemmatimonadales bacterium]
MTDLLLSFDFPPIGGGIARWMAELARRYPEPGLLVSTGTMPGADDRSFPAGVDRLNVPAHRLRTLGGLIRWRGRVRSLVRERRTGFVWCGNIRPAGYVAWRTRARDGIPYGVLLHGGDLLRLRDRFRRSSAKRTVARSLLGRARWLVANSDWTARLAAAVLAELGLPVGDRIVTVPLGTDPERFRPAARHWPATAGAGAAGRVAGGSGPVLLTVARLVPHKGIDVGIGVVAELAGRFPGLEYRVVGRGPDRARLERLAAAAGVASRVKFLDSVGDDALPGEYARADLYLGLSREEGLEVEGFGIAIADAMASGLPVVAGASGGTGEAVRDGVTGLRVPPAEASAVGAAVGGLLEDPARARTLGAAGRRWAETEGTWDRVAARLAELSRAAASAARR